MMKTTRKHQENVEQCWENDGGYQVMQNKIIKQSLKNTKQHWENVRGQQEEASLNKQITFHKNALK